LYVSRKVAGGVGGLGLFTQHYHQFFLQEPRASDHYDCVDRHASESS